VLSGRAPFAMLGRDPRPILNVAEWCLSRPFCN
jgi:hypothetical protein